MLTVIIYAAGEYPTEIRFNAPEGWEADPWEVRSKTTLRINDLEIDFELNEIIAITNGVDKTLYLNPEWQDSPYAVNELLTIYPLRKPLSTA